jgi:hypothetical protein
MVPPKHTRHCRGLPESRRARAHEWARPSTLRRHRSTSTSMNVSSTRRQQCVKPRRAGDRSRVRSGHVDPQCHLHTSSNAKPYARVRSEPFMEHPPVAVQAPDGNLVITIASRKARVCRQTYAFVVVGVCTCPTGCGRQPSRPRPHSPSGPDAVRMSGSGQAPETIRSFLTTYAWSSLQIAGTDTTPWICGRRTDGHARTPEES